MLVTANRLEGKQSYSVESQNIWLVVQMIAALEESSHSIIPQSVEYCSPQPAPLISNDCKLYSSLLAGWCTMYIFVGIIMYPPTAVYLIIAFGHRVVSQKISQTANN